MKSGLIKVTKNLIVITSFLMTLLFILVTFLAAYALYGAEGFSAAFQLIYPGSSCPICVGEAVLIAYLMVLFAATFMGVSVMMLSEVLRGSVATLAIAIGIILLPMLFSMPEDLRLLEQLWSYLPSDFVACWSIFSVQTVVIFGRVLQAWQAVPVLYIVLGISFFLIAKRVFVKYQVSGR